MTSTTRRVPAVLIMLAAWVAAVSSSWAGDAHATNQPARPRFYAFVNVGSYDVEEDLGLLGSASYEFQLAFGLGHAMGRFFAGEVELGVMGREHEVPSELFSGLDDPTLGIAWLSYSIVARIRVGKFEPFVGVGVGSGQARLHIVSDDVPPTLELEIDDDRGVLFLYRVGFDAAVGKRHRLGMELRRLDYEADLGEFTGGETNIGGTGALFTYRFMF